MGVTHCPDFMKNPLRMYYIITIFELLRNNINDEMVDISKGIG